MVIVSGRLVSDPAPLLRGYADDNDMPVEAVFETLLTGLAVRYYKAVAS